MVDWRKLQRELGVTQDNDFGRGSFTALFRRLGAAQDRAEELAIAATVHLPRYGIMDSKLRLAHFMAQVGHESGSFKYMEEIASGAAYEGRADLGNTQPGDGKRFKGRGPIQITGRANYLFFGRLLGIDLIRHPEMAANPSIGLHLACLFWDNRQLNAFADKDDIDGITRRINGGANGLADRKSRLTMMKGMIG
ncbi:glycoside hydrolase family 19 protein [Sphingobium sp. CR2-8]|uniref:glycoside hydrolase family 19 protein n=1 Tax=Sphingobium sp. CR2-8 TaxID=1306534 RepID=UPI002DBB7B7C|nr:glycoside hydrolase family 19 protein [Sphingobium sp. CR2-8]MEC3912202.1 glycoside hydrolase family 19 protein [Sphingobium sp. CR2-8]